MPVLDASRKASSARILVVDDSQLMRRCLRTLLEQHDSWKVCCEATNGKEAIQKVCSNMDPDVIILDFQMPEMNGLDAAKEIRRQSPEIPILMLTLHMSPQLADQAKRIGIRGACDSGNIHCVVEGGSRPCLRHRGTYYRN